MFIDEVTIRVTSGKGGNGMVHFRREKYVPFGGPDGGDGGKGGDVILRVRAGNNSLAAFQHKTDYISGNGLPGGSNNKTGRSGKDIIVHVPPGTMVFDASTNDLLVDLVLADQQFIVCKGGRGGRGNTRFATSRNQTPRLAEKGEPGEEKALRLELRLIADIGIVGVPNAGKSTLLAALTEAKPKIAAYPFTTLEPNLGVAQQSDGCKLVLADIPGLIEGAHRGVGLGHDFLRHIQRTRIIIHLLDGIVQDPLIDYAQINTELALFDPALSNKPQIVAVNKIDLPEVKERWQTISTHLHHHHIKPLAISALAGTNLQLLMERAHELLTQEVDKKMETSEFVSTPVYRMEADPREFTIERTSDGWRVKGKAIERAATMTYWEYEQSVRRFQRILHVLGVEEALRKTGIQSGDTVYIGNHELEWQD